MDTLFGTSLAEMTPEILEAFLETAGGEPLEWEAKADDDKGRLRVETVRRELCAFANSERGGHLILGARRTNAAWTLPGLLNDPPADLPVWVSQAADRVDPRPAVEIRDWPATGGRGPVGVVWIPPVAEPPAIVADGTIYHRVAGASRSVTDGRLLAELFRRGEAARERALTASSRALAELSMSAETYGIFAFAPTGGPRGFASPLFTSRVVQSTESAAVDAFSFGRLRRPTDTAILSDCVRVTVKSLGSAPEIVLAAFRYGAVGVKFNAAPNSFGNAAATVVDTDWSRVAWRTAFRVLSSLDAAGRMFIAIKINPSLGNQFGGWSSEPEFRDLVALGPPDDAELALIDRELRRADGQGVLDDDP